MIFRLDKRLWFPDPHNGEEDGLIALGGDLSVDRLLLAYSHGIFPWYGYRENEEILWWCPLRRFVIFPEEIHVSHSMRQLMNKGKYWVTFDQAFDAVMDNCGKAQQRDEQPGAWLGDDIKKAYSALNKQRLAFSVEVWRSVDSEEELNKENVFDLFPDTDMSQTALLVGGLYGVCLGCNFIGESMFSLEPNTSKLALISLADIMKGTGGIIDCQLETSHLKSMGGRYISYEEYMEILSK